jgi:hypothetical protein
MSALTYWCKWQLKLQRRVLQNQFAENLLSKFAFISLFMNSLSGGDDDAHGNQTLMEETFNAANAPWEITRYSSILHGYTDWYTDAYNLPADARSWESMRSSFEELLAIPEMTTGGEDENAPVVNDPSGASMTSFSPLFFLALAAVFMM